MFVPWNLQYKYEEDSEVINEIIKDKDVINDSEKKTIVYKRFYHVFQKGELEELISEFKNLEIIESFYDQSNWGVIVKKTKKI